MDRGPHGQNIEPESYHYYARMNDKGLKDYMAKIRTQVAEVVNALPAHADFVRQYAGASAEAWQSKPPPERIREAGSRRISRLEGGF